MYQRFNLKYSLSGGSLQSFLSSIEKIFQNNDIQALIISSSYSSSTASRFHSGGPVPPCDQAGPGSPSICNDVAMRNYLFLMMKEQPHYRMQFATAPRYYQVLSLIEYRTSLPADRARINPARHKAQACAHWQVGIEDCRRK